LDGIFLVEAIGTTVARTLAGTYASGSRINLERAMVLGERLNGHLVQGHVDGLAFLKEIREIGDFRLMEVLLPPEVHRMTLVHGSIALNGVSLTVNRLLDGNRVEVGIIPHTWQSTNFSWLRPGDALNVEGDLIGKYVGKLLRGGTERVLTGGESTDAV
jgi:riboflavin synthase